LRLVILSEAKDLLFVGSVGKLTLKGSAPDFSALYSLELSDLDSAMAMEF